MHQAIIHAAGLLDDMENEEYIRGMCELIACMFPKPDVCTCDRAEFIKSQIEERVRLRGEMS